MSGAIRPDTPSTVIRWLHLSDLHLQEELGWSQDVVLTSLLADVRSRYANQDRPQLLFLTGDIAFSGQREEYEPAEAFVRELCTSLTIDHDRVFVVPGNHDINRSLEEDAFNGARRSLTSSLEVDRFLSNEGRRRTLFNRQRAFRDFANRIMIPPDTYTDASYHHHRVVQLGPIRIRALLLDSSWLASGGQSDVGHIIVGEKQVIDCGRQENADAACFTFALMHHPFAWIADFEQVAIENLVIHHADVCLRGHVHAADLRATVAAERQLITFTAGATFESRAADNTYLWCSLDLASGRGVKILHHYNGPQNRWEATEPQGWSLSGRRIPAIDLGESRDFLRGLSPECLSYLVCLLSGYSTEVPIRLPTGAVVFASLEVDIPGIPNAVGELIIRIRHHAYWRRIWERGAWGAELLQLTNGWNGIVRAFSTDIPAELSARESQCEALLSSLGGPSSEDRRLTVSGEILALLETGDLVQARGVLDRWQHQGVLSDQEAMELLRVEIELLVRESEPLKALSRAEQLIASHHAKPIDFALCAGCAFETKDYSRAAHLMHQAIDGHVQLDQVKTLALKIAGAAGDATLTRKVLG